MTDRRAFISAVVGALVTEPPLARAQQLAKLWRIGVLVAGGSAGATGNLSPVLRQAFQELGYVEGKNVEYVTRAADGRLERLPELAAGLVALKVDAIITGGSEATRAAKQATASIPIVFIGPSYPVEEGLVAGFARPGGNITGITLAQSDHVSKHLQLLRDLVPALADVAVIWSPTNPGSTFTLRDTESAAGPLRLKVQTVPMGTAGDVDAALATIARLRPAALVVHPVTFTYASVQRISELAVKLRTPSITAAKQLAEEGLLMSYGADIRDLQRRAAGYIDRIRQGAKPADLPVERPTKFELVINMKTAKSLGLTIPPSLLQRADEVIQ